MRYIDDGENTSLAETGAQTHCLQRRTAMNTLPPAKSKWPPGGPKIADEYLPLVYGLLQSTFAK